MKIRITLACILSLVVFSGAFYTLSESGLNIFFISLFIMFSIFYTIIIILKLIFIDEKNFKKKNVLKTIPTFFIVFSLIVITVVSSVSYYLYDISKNNNLEIKSFTITNGNKVVIFQGMTHIGTEKFYKDIKNIIAEKKEEGYTHFFEGIKPGKNKKDGEIIEKITGIKNFHDLYPALGKLLNVKNQDYKYIIGDGINAGTDFNVDLDEDKIEEILNNTKQDNEEKTEKDKEAEKMLAQIANIDVARIIDEFLEFFNPKGKEYISYTFRTTLGSLLQKSLSEGIPNQDKIDNKLFLEIAIKERDNYLAKRVAESKKEKIIITYGYMHFKGFFENLQKIDKNWKIIDDETKVFFPFEI